MREIMPRMTVLCEAVVYCGHDYTSWKSYQNIESFSFGELVTLFHNWRDSLRKRIGTQRAKDHVFWLYIERLIESKKITHVFMPWIISQKIPRLSVPTGGMIMDLLWRHYPDEFAGSHEMDSILIQNLRNIDISFPVSSSTEAELSYSFDISDLNIATVPHGAAINEETLIGNSCPDLALTPFFLYPAQTTANKNHLCLFEAVRFLVDRGLDVKIVLTSRSISRLRDGDIRSRYESDLYNWLQVNSDLIGTNIELKGEVSWQELNTLYRGCAAIVLPSLYEGFGLPLVEALERNVAVICSGIAPFLEQIDRYQMHDQVCVVDPVNPERLGSVILDYLKHNRFLPLSEEELIERLSIWSWDDAAAAYIRFLSNIKTKHGGNMRFEPC